MFGKVFHTDLLFYEQYLELGIDHKFIVFKMIFEITLFSTIIIDYKKAPSFYVKRPIYPDALQYSKEFTVHLFLSNRLHHQFSSFICTRLI